MKFSMNEVLTALRANGLHDEAAAVGIVLQQRAELLKSLKQCLEKGKRWHSCDPVVVSAKQAISNVEK